MDNLLTGIKAVIDGLGSTVLLPAVIFIIGLAFGTKLGKAFRSGVMIGVAFIGINLVIGLMWGNLTDVAQAIVKSTGIQRDIVDVGWPSAAAIAFGSSVGLWVIPVGIAVNMALLFGGLTRTLNVDVWNFWHFAFIGSLVVAATNSLGMGLATAALMAALGLFFADWSAKSVQKFYGIPGVSVPHLASAQILPIAIGVNWLIERVPVVRDIQIDNDSIQRRLGVVGEPVILGLVIGMALGIIGYWTLPSAEMVTKALKTGINLAAVMLLLPRMVKILMEGLIPISDAARNFVQKRTGDREINIGLDSAILIGHPAAISASLILVPIAILLSVVLPGNRVILFADLAVIPFIVAMAAPVVNGNVFRMVLIGAVTLILGFYVATGLAPLFTGAATAAGFKLPENATQITSIVDGFLWISWVVVELVRSLNYAGIGILLALIFGVILVFKRNADVWERLSGSEAGAVAQ